MLLRDFLANDLPYREMMEMTFGMPDIAEFQLRDGAIFYTLLPS